MKDELNTDHDDCYYKGPSTNENKGYGTHGDFKHDNRNKESQPERTKSMYSLEDLGKSKLTPRTLGDSTHREDVTEKDDTKGMHAQPENA